MGIMTREDMLKRSRHMGIMTRKDLLNRLRQMEALGEDMDMPMCVSIFQTREDRRRRDGVAVLEARAVPTALWGGKYKIGDKTYGGELHADLVLGFKRH